VLVAAAVAVAAWQLGGTTHGPPAAPVEAAAAAPSLKLVVTSPATAHVAPVRTSVLRIAAMRGDCWLAVRVGSASGRRVYVGFLRQGGTIEFGLHRRLWIRLGDPTAVAVTLNGKPVSNLPRLAASVLVSATGWSPA